VGSIPITRSNPHKTLHRPILVGVTGRKLKIPRNEFQIASARFPSTERESSNVRLLTH
jgi:hypothetical protein